MTSSLTVHFLHNSVHFLNITVHFLHIAFHFFNMITGNFLNISAHFLNNIAYFLKLSLLDTDTKKIWFFNMPINPIHHGGMGVGYKVPHFKISKTKKDLLMKLFSQKHVSVAYIFCLFWCLVCVCVIWYDYHVISMIVVCKLCKSDKVLVYQQSFGIVYIFPIYVFLVSHCYTWNKKTVNNQ